MNARDPAWELAATVPDVDGRIAAVDWPRVDADLEAQGAAVIERLITPTECQALAALYSRDEVFRSRVVMARYGFGRGEYHCLHQDLYGEHVFPLQVVLLLSEPGRDFDGGEFVMTEQRPRMQSRPLVLGLRQGDAAVIAVHHRPVQGARGVYRVNLRHGVSRVHSGARHTAGIIFHDAA